MQKSFRVSTIRLLKLFRTGNYYLLFLILLFASCDQLYNVADDPVIARAGNSYLYQSELSDNIAIFSSQNDSILQAEKYIDFGKKKLEPFIKKKSKKKIYQFKNRLSFKNKNDLLNFYRSTIFYNKSKEGNLTKMFVKKNRLEVIKSAKLYEFY